MVLLYLVSPLFLWEGGGPPQHLSYIYHNILLGEPLFALGGFEPVGADDNIFLLFFLFWLCNPYPGIYRLIILVFTSFQTDLNTYFVCCFILTHPKSLGRLGRLSRVLHEDEEDWAILLPSPEG